MNKEERDQLKEELKDEIMFDIVWLKSNIEDISKKKTLEKKVIKEKETQYNKMTLLRRVREKWYSLQTARYNTPMEKLFGNSNSWQVWKSVLTITYRIFNQYKVDQLITKGISEEDANYVAEKLTQTIYDLKIEMDEKYNIKDL